MDIEWYKYRTYFIFWAIHAALTNSGLVILPGYTIPQYLDPSQQAIATHTLSIQYSKLAVSM